MFLWGLAWHNIRRNWGRTVLVVVGMASAGFILTASLALPSGHLPWAFSSYRAFMGGDIVVYPQQIMAAADDDGGGAWSWSPWEHPWINDLDHFHPSLRQEGFVSPTDAGPPYFVADELPQEITAHPDVARVEPLLVMPGLLRLAGRGVFDAPLRAVDIAGGAARGFADLVTDGRFFQAEDEGAMVALVNAASPVYWPRAGERTYPVPPLWEFVEVLVPTLTGHRDGYPVYDYGQLTPVNLRVVGHFSVHSGDSWILDEHGGPVVDTIGVLMIFPHFWNTPQIIIPSSTWRAIHRDTAGDQPIHAYQLGVEVVDTLTAGQTTTHLRELLPSATVRTVADQVMDGDSRKRISGAVPAQTALAIEAGMAAVRQPVSAPDLSRLVAYLAFALAGCLVMANMHVLVSQRRKELGVLRAVGMSGGEVVLMILYEITVLSLLGAAAGFAAVQLLVGSATALSGVGLARVIQSTLVAGLQVVGASTLVALVFGLWPAIRAARATTMEVLSDD